MELKDRLEDNNKTKEYLQTLKKVYLIGCWARFGVREHYFAGQFVEDDYLGYVPLVYDFDDHNGTYSEWILRKINETTTGSVYGYSFNKEFAEEYCRLKNIEAKNWIHEYKEFVEK